MKLFLLLARDGPTHVQSGLATGLRLGLGILRRLAKDFLVGGEPKGGLVCKFHILSFSSEKVPNLY